MKQVPSMKRLRASKAAVKRSIKRVQRKLALIEEIDKLKFDRLQAHTDLCERIGMRTHH